MMKNMWNLSLDDGAMGTLTPPDEIVAIQCRYLEEITNNNILAKITPYRNHDDHDTVDNIFEFEFFLTSPYTPNYKFSIMFMRHTIDYYPLIIELNNDIDNEIRSLSDILVGSVLNSSLSEIKVKNEDEFTHLFSQIINSKKMKNVINSLYSMKKSYERKNDIFFGNDDAPF